MKYSFILFTILLLAGCFLFTPALRAQNWDVHFVQQVNPTSPNSIVFRGLSSSVYPVSIAVPVGTFIVGEVQKNKKVRINAYEALGSIAISSIISEGLKRTIDRERPFEKYSNIYPYEQKEGKSFPSGHTTLAFATATTVSLQYKKWYVVVPAYAWAAGCGFSRLYLGEHYTTDVLAGAAIGTGSAFISHWITHKIFK